MAIECKHGRLARKCELCELEEALARISALEAERDKLKETIKDAIAVLNTVDSEAWEKNTITYGTATRVKSVMQDCRESIGGEGK